MQEFSSVIASSYDAAALAPMLDEKAREGWSIVSIVAAGTNIVAYLSRDVDAADAAPAADEAPAGTDAGAEIAATAEPAGWGAAPAAATTEPAVETAADAEVAETPAAADAEVTDRQPEADVTPERAADDEPTVQVPSRTEAATAGAEAGTPVDTAAEPDTSTESPAAEEPEADEPAAVDESAVPAGWYADPSGRYELRYWDGSAWTEHVSRAGQQYTDPPVA